MTIGERRVRTEFNPSNDSTVEKIKQKTAELINLCDMMRGNQIRNMETNFELNRLVELAQTHYEDAAMWAVKAATI